MKNLFLIIIVIVFIIGCKTQQQTSVVNPQRPSIFEETPEELAPEWLPKTQKYQSARKRENDLIHMKLNISFDWQKQYAFGQAELLFTPYFYSQDKLELDAKGFDINSVKIKSISGIEKNVKYTYDSLVIKIDLDREYKKGEKYFILIDYVAKPNELEAGGSEAITSDKGLYFINPTGENKNKPKQIWTQGETQASSCWFPTIDSPNEKITQEIYITVDTTYTTVSNGNLIYALENGNGTRTDYWRQEKPHAPYLVMMVVGQFAKVEDEYNDMAVDYYVEPEYEKHAKAIFGNTPEMIKFFSELLGYPYAWDKYSQIVVRDYVSGAMENTSASIFMEALHVDDRELLDQNWDGIIAHELFHHWFGDLVTCESWSNLPLNESFANYSEYLWDEHKYGVDQADMNALTEMSQYFNESRHKRVPLIRYNYKDKEDMFDSHSYAKGGRILHMLRKYVGDDAFFQSLSLYLKQNEFKTVEIHNLRLAFEEVTGEDLNWFFNQWFLNLGHPELKISHNFNQENKLLTVNVEQIQDSRYTPIYRLPLYIDYWVNGEKERQHILIDNKSESFVFNCNSHPDAILFDGEQQLLAVVKHEKSAQEIVNQYKYANNYSARYKALSYFSIKEERDSTLNNNELLQMYIDALGDKAWGIRDMAISSLSDYTGERKEEIYTKLKLIALQEANTLVRAQALYNLAESIPNKCLKEFEENINHKSYMVSAEALNGYLKSGGGSKNDFIQNFIDSDKEAYISVLAEYYSIDPKIENKEWYISKLEKQEAITYELIIFYSEFLEKLSDKEEVFQGIQLFKNIAIGKEYSFWQKFSAYQAIMVFEKNTDAEAALKFIKENETDERLKQYYEYF